MASSFPSRLGLVEGGADDYELFLKVFSGEVLTAFDEANIFDGKQLTNSISFGESAQFPVMGRAAAGYHAAGDNILENAGLMNIIDLEEKVIAIDALLVAPLLLDNLDELLNHYDARSRKAHELGEALATDMDKRLFRVLALAARSAANLTTLPAGTSIDAGATVTTDASVLLGAIFDAAQTLDENEVPNDGGRYLALRPAQWHLLVEDTTALNKDWNGSGDFSRGVVGQIAGFNIVMSNHLAGTGNNVVATVTGERNTYFDAAGFLTVIAQAWHTSAIGTVKLAGLKMEAEYKMEYQANFLNASMAMGHGILRPEAAIQITNV